ncbi:MAG: queuosine precursor transporter [Candidatus Roizmanbacteria bacterium]|nr:queuosine precursor transporter [Candidatus Roizmanbacteria bacterium]
MKIKSLAINKLDFLISLYIFCILASEVMGVKTFSLLNTPFIKLNASVSIFLLPLVFTINDVITEVYGAEKTRSIVRSGLVMIFLLSLFSFFFTTLTPSTRFLKSEDAYDLIFKQSTRIAIASLTAFGIADLMDVLIFVKIRNKFGSKALWFRNNVSNIISQFLDTFIFMSLAFYDLSIPFHSNSTFLIGLILPYWFLKCILSVIETPFVYLGVKWLRKDT